MIESSPVKLRCQLRRELSGRDSCQRCLTHGRMNGERWQRGLFVLVPRPLQMEGSRQGGAVRGRVDGPLTHLERPSEHLGERREDRAGKTRADA